MAVIVRIDVDRAYGRQPVARHVLSRLCSDLYFPKLQAFGYLAELRTMLHMLTQAGVSSHVFFRRCTAPTRQVLELMDAGDHEVGLHLEDSRSYETFLAEKRDLERHVGRAVTAFSKHGSGKHKYGLRHHAPYEPDRYVEWARQSNMTQFMGNLEDPSVESSIDDAGLRVFPAAFWLETHWRDTARFTVDWLIDAARTADIVLLIHPENVLADAGLRRDFRRIVDYCAAQAA